MEPRLASSETPRGTSGAPAHSAWPLFVIAGIFVAVMFVLAVLLVGAG